MMNGRGRNTPERWLWRVVHALRTYGVDAPLIYRKFTGLPTYRRNRVRFLEQYEASPAAKASFPLGRSFPCLDDRRQAGGSASGHYFHQDLLVAQLIHDANPRRHIDVGSRVDGFVAHVASFRSIEVLDIRQLRATNDRIVFMQRDVMEADPRWDSSCDSLSCLHALEHFGLGRYGDRVDVDGWRIGWDNLVRMVTPNGRMYFSTPIGPQRVEFDAHRVFSVAFLVSVISETFGIERFSYVDDQGDLHDNVEIDASSAESSFGCRYGCGIFVLRRLAGSAS